MRFYFYQIFVPAFAALLLGATACHSQEAMFNHLFWSAKGTHGNQSLGGSGLDTIGYVNDTIRHAFAIGEDGGMSYVFNRFPGDTARQYKFPGQKIVRCNLNGDTYPDFVCYDGSALGSISLLLGTVKIDSFETLHIYRDPSKDEFRYLDGRFCVTDANADGYDDLIINEMSNELAPRLLFYRGGTQPDTLPYIITTGLVNYGELVAVGHVRDTTQNYLLELRFVGPTVKTGNADTAMMFLFKLGHSFNMIPADTITCTFDTSRFCCMNLSSFQILDIDGDNVDDIVIAGYDNNYTPNLQIDPTVFVYKGGDTISSFPTYYFHRPHQTNSSEFGTMVIDVGNATGHGYHSIIITDPDASDNGDENGAVFMYNIGKALKDSCVAYAVGPVGYMEQFGSAVICIGDTDSAGLSEFAVGSNVDTLGASGLIGGAGEIDVFHGSPSYGPMVGISETALSPSPQLLIQNYPNPFSNVTTIAFVLQNAEYIESQVSLSVYDMLGREVARLYHGKADNLLHTVQFSAANLPTGEYCCHVSYPGQTYSNILQVLH